MTEASEARPEPTRAVIRDKRKIKPTGGAHRAADAGKPASAPPGSPTPASEGEGGAPGAGPAGPDATAQSEAATAPAGGTESAADAGSAPPSGAAADAGGTPPSGAAAPESTPEPEGARPADATTGGAEEGGAPQRQEPPATPAAEPAGGLGAELDALRTAVEDRTRDLQRVTAEYANYRKRVERDRALVSEQATSNVLTTLLPVLDDLDRARDHGELVDGFAAVAEQLIGALTKLGLTAFGEKGDPFDPNLHEAVAHLTSAEVDTPTCIDILRRGYLLGDRLLRPAMVAVAGPPGDQG